MENLLPVNSVLRSQNGINYRVNKLLGSGGQGEVYEVFDGRNLYALKWYFKHTATPLQRKVLLNLIDNGKPSDDFLFPLDFVESSDGTLFGYVMKLRPKEFKGIVDLMKGKVQVSFRNLIKACFNLTKGYQLLHSQGYQYRDISFGNVFFNPNNGKVLICDNDNVVPNGIQDSGVLGTPTFMAPEIVRGEAMPSRNTDKFSLAVLLFYMLMIAHPLEGIQEAKLHCKDLVAQRKLYGTNPIFIYDPNNNSNRPVKGIHDNAIFYWEKVYPQYLKELFTTAFTVGLQNPARRVTENEWLDCFSKLLAGITLCSKCGEENFFDPDKKDLLCWNCNSVVRVPVKLVVDKKKIVLGSNAKIFSHYLFDDFDLDTVVAELVRNPNNPKIWGLKNKTASNWTYSKNDGSQITIVPEKSAVIARGVKINFGKTIGFFE